MNVQDSRAMDEAKIREVIDRRAKALTVVVSGDLGVSHSLNLMTGTSPGGHDRPEFPETCGQWKVAHEHSSVPFYMDCNFRAAIDLRP
jgi:ketosteroid isomerase-like protein